MITFHLRPSIIYKKRVIDNVVIISTLATKRLSNKTRRYTEIYNFIIRVEKLSTFYERERIRQILRLAYVLVYIIHNVTRTFKDI